MLQAIENDHVIQECMTEKQAPNGQNLESSLTHEMKCLKRTIEVQKPLIEELKEEAKRRILVHEAATVHSHKKDQIMACI